MKQFGIKEQSNGDKSSIEESRGTGWNTKATWKRRQEEYWADGLYLGTINCRDLFTDDDWSLGIEKWEVHGKEEATKQQKRKDKAAISVRALHKLEEIARPSDSFLFYHDVEKEIEQGKRLYQNYLMQGYFSVL